MSFDFGRFRKDPSPARIGKKGDYAMYNSEGKVLAMAPTKAALKKLSAYLDEERTPIKIIP